MKFNGTIQKQDTKIQARHCGRTVKAYHFITSDYLVIQISGVWVQIPPVSLFHIDWNI